MRTVLLLAALLLAVPAIAVTPTADACIQVYIGFTAGPVEYRQNSPCSEPQVYVDGEPVLP